jgi:hypothetical protein
MHLQVYRGEEKGENARTRTLARLSSSGRAGHGVAWRWAWAHDLLLLFIFAMSPCIIRFDIDRPSRLRDAVTLGGSSLYIRASATEIATYQQPQKHQHI